MFSANGEGHHKIASQLVSFAIDALTDRLEFKTYVDLRTSMVPSGGRVLKEMNIASRLRWLSGMI